MKPNLGVYIQKINDLVTETETIGETMNPDFEIIRNAIDSDQLASLSTEKLAEIHANFSQGTAKYVEFLAIIKGLKAPVKVIGIHKKLEKGYGEYVAGCQEMVNAIDPENQQVDVPAFNAAESKQDETTDTIAFCIQRMTSLVMK